MRLSDHDFLIWANFVTEFGENLRWPCGLRKSVSFVARELGINRQQFGRYVNNKSYPNTHNLIAICDYFNVQAADFELPHSEFSQKYRKVSLLKQGPAQRTLEFPLDAYFRQSPRLLERFRGDYLIYFNTKTWPDHYMIAFCRVFSREDATFFRYIIRGREPLLGNRILFKGGGQAAKFEHNVFIQSYSKPLAGPLVSEIILIRDWTHTDLLPSRMMSTHIDTNEILYKARLWRRLGLGTDLRAGLKASGLVRKTSPRVSTMIRDILEGPDFQVHTV